jgi:predicted nuclease with TOPRIM domain
MSANKEEDDRMERKLKEGIDKLQEIIDQIDEYNSIAMEKFNWLEEEIVKYEDHLDDMREEIEIITSKTQKDAHRLHPIRNASDDDELK